MPEKPGDQPNVRTLDAGSLRGLAHPLRMRLLAALRLDGPATASQLAQRLGESSGATSYHLRQLAAHGFVEDAPERGKGRERWWQASHDGTAFDEGLIHADDAATRGAADVFLAEIARIHTQELNTWLATAHAWPTEWREASDLSDFTLNLTPAQSQELIGKLHDLINSYRDLPPSDTDPGAGSDADSAPVTTESVRIHTHVIPRRAAQ
ncbi:ArsR/SmtB family transcription factor [Streptomyces subrutilus]|uniref:Transcriptional regulator n=1 Tax=Streptomyces subrutilus TaxID=36818 RepID=A0A1E5PS14_9ACTN|nr:winged helix-turn-helix domain-containing protein [Streptomyces subrutilus]OEJ32172.1 transcriptional regulator [Streptomyces subrutilus]